MDYVLNVLVRGMDTTTLAAVLDDLLKQAIVDKLLSEAEAAAFEHDIASSRGAAAATLAEWYMEGGFGRADRQLYDLWLYVAAMNGDGPSASIVAQRVAAMTMNAGMGALSETDLHAGKVAVAWWSKLAADSPAAAASRLSRLKDLAERRRAVGRTIRHVNSTTSDIDDDPWCVEDDPKPAAAVGVAGMPLEAWRTMPVKEIAERIKEYRSLAARLTGFDDEEGRAILTRAVSGSVRDSLAVADLIAERADFSDDEGFDSDGDLRWAWVTLAAIGHHAARGGPDREVAKQLLITRLLDMAADKRLYGQHRTAMKLMRLAGQWADDIRSIAGMSISREDHYLKLSKTGLDAVRSATEVAKKVETMKADAAAKAEIDVGAAMVVVKSIDQGGNKAEDKAMVKAWEALTKPVKLASGPEPDVLESVLRAEFPWLGEAIEAIVGDLRLRRDAGRPWAYWRPILLVGPAGSGKTRFARRLAALMGTGFGEVAAGGSSDNRMLAGTARGWSTASPSYVLQVIKREMTANPVILVDEVDKASQGSRNGDIKSTLLSMLEPLSARAWPDECLVGACDISAVNWVLAANDTTPLRGPLLTRLRVLDAPTPTVDHFDVVLAGIRRDLAAELGVDVDALPELMPEAEAKLLSGFKRGISLRRVRAALEGAIKVSGGVQAAVRH